MTSDNVFSDWLTSLLTFFDKAFYYTSYINYHKYINLIGQWVKIRARDHTGQKIIFREIKIIFHPLGSLRVFPSELSFFDRKTLEALGTHHFQATVAEKRCCGCGFQISETTFQWT